MPHVKRAPVPGPQGVAASVARNVHRLRAQQGISLQVLAEREEIAPETLTALEAGQTEPSLDLSWRVARVLGVPFATLIEDQAPAGTVVTRKNRTKLFVSENLGLTSCALFAFGDGLELYELRLAPGHREDAKPHAPGTSEILYVSEGSIEVSVDGESHLLDKGDTIRFAADVPHAYRNLTGVPAQIFLVMSYAANAGHAQDHDAEAVAKVPRPATIALSQ